MFYLGPAEHREQGASVDVNIIPEPALTNPRANLRIATMAYEADATMGESRPWLPHEPLAPPSPLVPQESSPETTRSFERTSHRSSIGRRREYPRNPAAS